MRTRILPLLASAGVTATLFAASAGTAHASATALVGCGSAGKVTAKMCRLYKAASSASSKGGYHWDSVGCKHPDPMPYHPQGRACDLVYGKIGKAATGDNKADGAKMVTWLVKYHAKYAIDHVIWQGIIYSPNGNWHGHADKNCKKGSGVTVCHRDHVHVAVKP